jgi:hypothetical protein
MAPRLVASCSTFSFGDRKSGVVAAVAELASSPLIKVQAPATTSTCTPIENGILTNLLSWMDLNEDARSLDLLGYEDSPVNGTSSTVFRPMSDS